MSAIAGFLWLDGHDAQPRDLARMLDAMAHRGPDGCDAWVDGPVALGHQMRWSTPESIGERMPLVTIDGDIALTSDARLDNRDELCAAVSVPFPDRASITDGALIVLAYRKWGEACASRLLGDFAFVLWDARSRRLLCAIDALSSLPLEYACPPGRFAFASEAKALHALGDVPRRLNDARLAERGVVGIFAHDKESTFFEGIRRVPPGHTLTVRPEGMRLGCYWDPATVPPPDLHADDDYVDAMRDRFTQAVRCRLRSAYPVASLLSGGLDSSAVSVVAARELSAMGRRLLTISSVLPQDHPGPERDERPFIDAITQIPGVDWCAVAPHVGLYDGLEDEFFWNEAPSAPRHDIYHGLYEAAGGGGARTLLDGRGGELGMTAHGKEYLLHLLTERRWLRLVRALRGESRVQGVSRTRHAFRQLVRPLFARRRVRSQFARRALAESPLAPELITRYRIYERLDEAADAAARRSRGSIRDQRVYAASRLQRPDGAYTEAFGTRGAFPFRDRRVIELSIHLPESLTRFRGYSRGLVRRSLDGMLPPSIQWRRDKMAFSPNYHSRLRSARDQMREELEGVRADDPIHRYLDLQKMRAALSALSEVPDWSRGAPGFPGPSAAVVLDHGLLLLRFVRWCGVE